MQTPSISVVDASTGEIRVREMTEVESAAWASLIAELSADKAAKETAAAEKAAARQVLLDKLGITEDEARLLLS